ncbi:MAG: helix-turn-helix transcriptional regulator [Saprospiraceae bacterium]
MINKNIKYLRSKSKVSQQELAEAIGVEEPLWEIMNEEGREPDIRTLMKLSDYFSVLIDDMIRKDMQKEDYEIIGINI